MSPANGARHALIIEDEMLIALEVESLLHEFGFSSCDIADNPEDALRLALARRPDLMTADLRIVGGTGIEAVDAITAHLGPIPHVYVTGNPDMLQGPLGAGRRQAPDPPRARRRLRAGRSGLRRPTGPPVVAAARQAWFRFGA